MGTIDTELIRRWIIQKIMFEQATITYRDLAQESSCSFNQARELLDEFSGSEDAKRLKVQSNYLIFGLDKPSTADCVNTYRIELIKDSELQEFRSTFYSVSHIQIYSISATQAPDPNLLKSSTSTLEPISLKPKDSVEKSCRNESHKKELESNTESKTDQSGTKAGDQASVKTTLTDKVKPTKTSQKSEENLKKKDIINSKKDKIESKTTTTTTNKNKRKIKSDQDTKQNECEETNPINNKLSARSEPKMNDEKNKQIASAPTDSKQDEPTSRKRVRKTRIRKKMKTIRVKDKKGYRVNRTEIEEIEESYSDWESSDNEIHNDHDKLKQIKNKNEIEIEKNKPSQEVMRKDKESPLDTSPTENPDQSVVKPAKDVPKNRPLNNPPPSKKKISAPNSKDQSNITSFFKKG